MQIQFNFMCSDSEKEKRLGLEPNKSEDMNLNQDIQLNQTTF